MQLSPTVKGRSVPFDSTEKSQQLIHTRLKSFSTPSVYSPLLSGKCELIKGLCNPLEALMAPLASAAQLSSPHLHHLSWRWRLKFTHTHTHDVMAMLKRRQHLWVTRSETNLQELMRVARVYPLVVPAGRSCRSVISFSEILSSACWGFKRALISHTQ